MLRQLTMLAVISVTGLTAYADEGKPSTATGMQANDPRLQWRPCPEFMPKGCRVAVLNGDPTKPNADVFFKIPSGETIPTHTHTSAERMVLVSGQLRVTYEGKQPFTMQPGTYAYGPAKAPHSATCAKGQDCVLFIAFEQPVDAIPMAEKH